jgi:hypothetical protein
MIKREDDEEKIRMSSTTENKENMEVTYLPFENVNSKSVYSQLEEFTRIAKYAQYNRKNKRRETWDEQVERVFKMHKVRYQKNLDDEKFNNAFMFAKQHMLEKNVLGSQRALQFGGPAILNKNARIYNCFSANTSFRTDQGIRSFNDFSKGSNVVVLGSDGWINATIQCFGMQELYKLTVKSGEETMDIHTTHNHRWILDGVEDELELIRVTENLKCGDWLLCQESNDEEWEVVSVVATNIFENVWCVVEPLNEEFTLACGIITKNCGASYVDRPRVFQEVMFALLCGVGIGFSVQLHHIAKLPGISKRGDEVKEHAISDSIEGWADAVGILMSSYFEPTTIFVGYSGKKIIFDYSLIREKGSAIKHIGGKAPGPDGLKNSLEKIEVMMDSIVESGVEKLSPIHAYDVLMHCSDAVLSGGIRRAATIAIFSLEDEEMVKAKTGTWYIDNPQRARSNNSALLLRDETPENKFMEMIESVKQFGEPGMIFADSKETLFNPCVPDDTWVMTGNGSMQVKDLLGVPFMAVVNGKEYPSRTGFVKTGHKQVFTLVTKEGFEVKATANHKIFTTKNEWVALIDLEIGDKIVIHDHSSRKEKFKESNEFGKGWVMGLLCGSRNGYSSKENMHEKSSEYFDKFSSEFKNNNKIFMEAKKYIFNEKNMTDAIEKESFGFQAGFLRGMFDISGNVCVGTDPKIYYSSINIGNIKRIQRMALRLGVYGKIEKGALTNFGYDYSFVITGDNIPVYKNNISFYYKTKKNKLEKLVNNGEKAFSSMRNTATVAFIWSGKVCDVYDCTVDGVHAFDACGVYVHNCVEISLYGYDEDGNSGFQVCNLSEINMKKVKTADQFLEVCSAAAILGTFQAGYTTFPYLGPVTQRIVEREALIGVSMTGMMDSPEIAFSPEILQAGADVVKKTNKDIAELLGINQASRTTCVKPAGSTSCILGTASGIHPRHAKRYFRRVQMNKLEGPLDHFRKYNPKAIEESVWSTNKNDDVVTFLCKSEDESLTKGDVSGIDLLKKVKLVQQHWVTAGKNLELCVQPYLNHNVSNTISVKNGMWGEVARFIYNNRYHFAGISLLSESGDMIYQQAPFQEVLSHIEISHKYGAGALFSSGLIVHAHGSFDGNLYNACSCFLGTGEKLKMPTFDLENILESYTHSDSTYKKIRWVAQANKFSKRHFNGDNTRMTECLKAVDAWKRWCDLKRTYVNVEWDQFFEDDDNTKATEYIACSGNKCEVIRF